VCLTKVEGFLTDRLSYSECLMKGPDEWNWYECEREETVRSTGVF